MSSDIQSFAIDTKTALTDQDRELRLALDAAKVGTDAVGRGFIMARQACDDARDVAAIAVQQLARIGALQLFHRIRVQVVEAHAQQRVVHDAILGQT